jgi:flagellin-like hook-associated protein FlgL
VDIDLAGAQTLQDVLDIINTAGAGALTATLAGRGNGLVITDNTTGPGTLTAANLNGSLALQGLGLEGAAVSGRLMGRDVNPVRVDSPFTALLDLKAGMAANDRATVTAASARLERVMKSMQQVQGVVASQARALEDRSTRVGAETDATKIMLSNVRDVDFADAVVRFQQLQTALQANLSTAGQVMNLSVLDYLR